MRKRRSILALLLAGCLMVTIAPTEVFAQEELVTAETQQDLSDPQEESLVPEDVESGQQTVESISQIPVSETTTEVTGKTPGSATTERTESVEDEPEEMTEEEPEKTEEIPVDPQDPGKYRLTGEGTGDVQFSQISTQAVSPAAKYADCIIQKGIDVSYHNGTINWQKVKNDGVDFAFIRVGYRGYENGKLAMDSKAIENMRNANKAGVPIGVYFFSQAVSTSEASKEADYIVSKIAGYQIDLPVVFDFEYVAVGVGRLYKAHLSKGKATDVCNAFCKRVRAYGYTPMVYASKSMYEDKTYAADISQESPIWMAHYTKGTTNYAGEYEYWQYSSSGKVDGIKDHYVDFNLRYLNSLRIGERTSNSISLKWDAFEDAVSYDIYRKSGSGSYQLLKSQVTDTAFTDTGLSAGKDYSYKIYAKGKCIGFNTGITFLSPVVVKLTGKGSAFDKVSLKWSKALGANAYSIQRYDSIKKAYVTIKNLSGSSKISYTDKDRNAGKTYMYRVMPFKVVFNGRVYGTYSNAAKAKTKASVKGKTKSKSIRLRKSASSSSKSLGKIKKKGTKVKITGSQGSWYRLSVKINGKKRTGYIKKSSIRVYK